MATKSQTTTSLPFEEAKTSTILFGMTMRSLQYLLLGLFGVIILVTVVYFGQRSYFHHKPGTVGEHGQIQHDGKSSEVDLLIGDKGKPTEESKTTPAKEQDNAKPTETTSTLLLPSIEGSLYLKSIFKSMECTAGETSLGVYSVSCCGKFNMENSTDEPTGCLILEAQKSNQDKDNYMYRMKLTVDNSSIGFSQVLGFPEPGKKCFDINKHPGHQICVSLNIVPFDMNISNEKGYSTCTLIAFGTKNQKTEKQDPPEIKDIVSKTESLPCDTDKDKLFSKVGTEFFVTLRITAEEKKEDSSTVNDKLKQNSSAEENIVQPKGEEISVSTEKIRPPYEGSIYLKSAFENMKCDMKAFGLNTDSISLACCGTLTLQENKEHQEGCLLVNSVKNAENKNFIHEVKLTVDKKVVGSEKVEGIPEPGKSCYHIADYPGQQLCLSLQFLLLDENVSNESEYKTCKLMVFDHKHDESGTFNMSAATRTLSNEPCNTEKRKILDKTGNNAVVLRLNVEPITEDKTKKQDPYDLSEHLNKISKEESSKEKETNEKNTSESHPDENGSENKHLSTEEKIRLEHQTVYQKVNDFFHNFNSRFSNFFSRAG